MLSVVLILIPVMDENCMIKVRIHNQRIKFLFTIMYILNIL